ncbi:hypothetical protein DM01DRAFT_1338122 [Hesseltinella vesiculosa]|uniref:PHD-type domain-containing protein n=1 Tax=Hesseltinella vesiculosa TaxID=101127 RepID=A0A1X2GAV8_9FUNG|nr:hypothetical protein DM01DRAFT_1338122 [Hesseltinella vesiculosa]
MTAHRRSRSGLNGRKRKSSQRIPQRRRSQSTSDEPSSDDSSTTRCLCGETHSVGLMVQCDKCEVWQHCECIGLAEQDIPDQYYCEQCKPVNHAEYRTPNGKLRHTYNSDGMPQIPEKKAPKKRMTMNSQEASLSLEDVLATRQVLGLHSVNHTEVSPSTSPTKTAFAEKPPLPQPKRKRDVSPPTPDSASSDLKEADQSQVRKSLKRQKENDNGLASSSSSQPSGQHTPSTKRSQAAVKRTSSKRSSSHKPSRSRTSTPQPPDEQPSPQELQPPTTYANSVGDSLFERFSAESRAISPPAKVRYPSARMSLSEMSRRAKQILEYISSIQVDLANKQPGTTPEAPVPSNTPSPTSPCTRLHHMDTDQPSHPLEEEDDDDTSSLSSASTIPLEEDRTRKESQTSLEIMDLLTRELIKFQRKYDAGSLPASTKPKPVDVPSPSLEEGRVTRSSSVRLAS